MPIHLPSNESVGQGGLRRKRLGKEIGFEPKRNKSMSEVHKRDGKSGTGSPLVRLVDIYQPFGKMNANFSKTSTKGTMDPEDSARNSCNSWPLYAC